MEILSVEPNGIEQGSQKEIVIHGDGFASTPTVTFSGLGITVNEIVSSDANSIILTVNVSRLAAVGFRDVSVALSDGSNANLAGGIAVTNFQSLTTQLRLLTGERITVGKTEADTNFSNDELIDIIFKYRGNLYLAASEVWGAKAAESANLVDITESGSERKLSQLFRNANAMSEVYKKYGSDIEQQLIDPVVGQSVSWLRPNTSTKSDLSADPFYDPFLFLFAQRAWLPMAFAGDNSGVAMWGGRFQ